MMNRRCTRPQLVPLMLAFGLCLVAFGKSITEKDRRHWAFQPLQPIKPPPLKQSSSVSNPIDQFILAALETNQLTLAPRAGKEPLIRRVTFDLIGLPPTPE